MAHRLAVELQDPVAPSPSIHSIPGNDVSFCHPDYQHPHDILFRLPRLDRYSTAASSGASLGTTPAARTVNANATSRGVHFATALLACQIVANNAFDGYLATDSQGRERVIPDSPDYVLVESKYWFFSSQRETGDSDAGQPTTLPTRPGTAPAATTAPRRALRPPYAIVPSFQDWQFPHDSLPEEWRVPITSDDSSSTTNRRCVVTNRAWPIHGAHLIPSAEERWYINNGMPQYGMHQNIDEAANKIDLRDDLHHAFDDHMFAIVPKQGRRVVHVLSAPTLSKLEYAAEFHNRPIFESAPTIRDSPPEFLFARFARAVLMLVKPFVAQAALSRRVARYKQDVGGQEAGEGYEGGGMFSIQEDWMSPQALKEQYGGGGTRSASPSKRKRDVERDGELDDEDYGFRHSSSDEGSSWSDRLAERLEEQERGRPRKRRRIPSRAVDHSPTQSWSPTGTPPSLEVSFGSVVQDNHSDEECLGPTGRPDCDTSIKGNVKYDQAVELVLGEDRENAKSINT
ncbi:putative HNH nuclease domain-containing protein [Seiridium cardinale]